MVDRAPPPGHARVVLADVVGVARPVPTGTVLVAVAHAPVGRTAALQEAAVRAVEATTTPQEVRATASPVVNAEEGPEVAKAPPVPAMMPLLIRLLGEERAAFRRPVPLLVGSSEVVPALLQLRLAEAGHLHAQVVPKVLVAARVARDVATALHAPVPPVLPDPALVPAVAGVVAAGQAVVAVVPPAGAPVTGLRAPSPVLPPAPAAEIGRQGGEVV